MILYLTLYALGAVITILIIDHYYNDAKTIGMVMAGILFPLFWIAVFVIYFFTKIGVVNIVKDDEDANN